MAITLSTGATVSVASTFGAAVTTTAASNEAECILLLDNDPAVFAIGDIVEVTSGWDLLNLRVVRIKAQDATSVTLEGVNTTSTLRYPALGGTGSIRKISAWTAVTQIKTLAASGGEQNFTDVTTLADQTQKEIPTTRSVVKTTVDVYDDPSLGWYAAVQTADDAKAPYGYRLQFLNGVVQYANAYWSAIDTPVVAMNEGVTGQVAIAFAAKSIRYAS